MNFNHGAQECVGHSEIPQDIQHVGLLVDVLWMAHIPHVNQHVLTRTHNCTSQIWTYSITKTRWITSYHLHILNMFNKKVQNSLPDVSCVWWRRGGAYVTECLMSSSVAANESMSWCGSCDRKPMVST